MRPFLILPLLIATSCAPLEPELDSADTALVRDAIVGGTINSGDPQVFMLVMLFDDGSQGSCTATLIAPQTLLTAAHCVDPRTDGKTSVNIVAMNKTSIDSSVPSDYLRVVETRWHPGWNPSSPGVEHDIALARLEAAPNVTPKPWNSASVNQLGGLPLRAVGYGRASGDPNTAGIKRQVALTFRQLTQNHILLGDLSGKGICHGDSGGPSFHTFSDGIERVVGVHSVTLSAQCTDGADTRTDAYAAFINQWLSEKEAPTCAQDGRCKSGCAPVDQDCVCVADGTCNTQCLNLQNDPDCPKDCIANGVCSIQPCPTPDVDCVAPGGTCTKEEQCLSRMCISDGQRPDFYCSSSCSQPSDCPSGMQCMGVGICQIPLLGTKGPDEDCQQGTHFCTGRTVCAGPAGGRTRCQPPCDGPSDCALGSTCELGEGGVKYCHRPPPPSVTLVRAHAQGPASSSCAAAGGLPASLGLFLVVVAMRRRPGGG